MTDRSARWPLWLLLYLFRKEILITFPRLLAGQKFSIEDIDEVKKGVMGSREPGRGGKFFIEG